MQEYRGYELSAAALGRELVAGQVCVLTVGKSKVGRLFVLPLATWSDTFEMEFGADVLGNLVRVSTRTATNDGLEEAVLLRVLVEQVDVGGNMVATSCLVVRLGGEDAAILVPANAFWRERVEPCVHLQADGCCGHPDAMTPECHRDACPEEAIDA